VRDAAAAETRGIPAALVVVAGLAAAARATAAAVSAGSLSIVPLEANLVGLGRAEVAALAGGAARQAVASVAGSGRERGLRGGDPAVGGAGVLE
jgi:hypothetical protein